MNLEDGIYSNCEHVLNELMAKYLKKNPGRGAIHSAWNFCAAIKWDGKQWVSEIWTNGSIDQTIYGKEIMDVINEANETYGDA